ncbi:MAG: hypothetical protein GWO08_10560, partial [Gammaproteobacteria bacterium]|nr:hypothetical protein [Gammaproteobacteria bacterium]
MAVTPGLYEVEGNPNCGNLYQATVVSGPDTDLLDLGPLYGFKYNTNPTADVTHPLTNDGVWEVTSGPQDPYNSVSIFNVVLSESQGVQFDWSATLGIDAVIVKAQDANAYVYYPEEFGDAGLMAPDGKSISHIEFCYDYELFAEKTADASYNLYYDWTITKGEDGEYWKFIGDPAWSHDYDIIVDRTEREDDFAVSGVITVKNPTPFNVTFEVSDVLEIGEVEVPVTTVTCGTYLLGPAEQTTCSYSVDLDAKANGKNVATVNYLTAEYVGEGDYVFKPAEDAEALFYFGDPKAYIGPSTVNVTDTFPYPGGTTEALGSASEYTNFDNDQTFECSSNPDDYTNGSYSYTKVNRA